MDSIWWLYSPVDNLTFTYTFVADWPGDPAVSGNVNITEDGYCFGQIKGDPDVAGWGVSKDSFGDARQSGFVSDSAVLGLWWLRAERRHRDFCVFLVHVGSIRSYEVEASAIPNFLRRTAAEWRAADRANRGA